MNTILELTTETQFSINDSWMLFIDRSARYSKLIYKSENVYSIYVLNDTLIEELYHNIKSIDALMKAAVKSKQAEIRGALGL